MHRNAVNCLAILRYAYECQFNPLKSQLKAYVCFDLYAGNKGKSISALVVVLLLIVGRFLVVFVVVLVLVVV